MLAALLALRLLQGTTASHATYRCTAGATIPHSSRAAPSSACPPSSAGDECTFTCDAGFLAIGRHVCQSYSTMGVAVIDQAFFGGRCDKLCGTSAKDWSCGSGLVPVRVNATAGDSACLKTTCLAPMEALQRLARGNWEVWKLGRYNPTGMYIDHVDPLVGHAEQQSTMASADSAGPGLAIECIAASLGYQTLEEAAAKVLLTLQSFAGETAGFADPRNPSGWLPTFMVPENG